MLPVSVPRRKLPSRDLRWAKMQNISEEERAAKYPSLEESMPTAYAELNAVQQKLEDYFHDMQDLEFTIQDGKLWMLQTRNGKRTGTAMVKMAVDMLEQGMINEETALLRLEAAKLDELLHPVFDKEAQSKAKVLTKGLPASPGPVNQRSPGRWRRRYINSASVRICWMAIMFATDYAAISVLAMPIVKRISVASVKWRI